MLIGAVRNLALFAAVLRPAMSALKEYISPAFAHPILGLRRVSFQS